jgi:1,2-dihydroxy-3-keto-5-methylthiopentene dioxygenase
VASTDANHRFGVLCTAGDLIGVPAGTTHWLDMGDPTKVKTKLIRFFLDGNGWIPHYTGSNFEEPFVNPHNQLIQ